MNFSKEKIYELIDEITRLVKNNERADGSFRFDPVRAVVALEFVKMELEKSIAAKACRFVKHFVQRKKQRKQQAFL